MLNVRGLECVWRCGLVLLWIMPFIVSIDFAVLYMRHQRGNKVYLCRAHDEGFLASTKIIRIVCLTQFLMFVMKLTGQRVGSCKAVIEYLSNSDYLQSFLANACMIKHDLFLHAITSKHIFRLILHIISITSQVFKSSNLAFVVANQYFSLACY